MNDTQVVSGGGPKIQQISGSVSTTVDTTGLATSAKQDSLLTELQLKADLTETQPVSLASVPSHAVTNAGTFATQVTTVNGVAPAFGTGVRGATVQRVTIATDDSVPVTLAANQSVNVAQVNGVTPLMGAGNTGTGSPRVTIATDQATIPVSLASVPSHAVTNAGTFATQESQILADNAGFTDGTTKVFTSGYIYDEVAGTALTENDVAAARVNVNRSQIGIIEDGVTRGRYATVSASNALKVDGSAVTQPVSLSANQSVNNAQINGVTPLMGNGVTGTGSQRVTIASDNTAFLVKTNEIPDATSTFAPTNSTSTAYETNRVAKASAGVLYCINGYNSKTSSQFIQVHNTASLPADTAVPVITFTVQPSSNFSLDFGGKYGRYFSTGITICNSSTGPTKTVGSADCWFDVQYS